MSGGGRVETSAPALISRCGYDCEMAANRLLAALLLAASGGTCIVDALDRGIWVGTLGIIVIGDPVLLRHIFDPMLYSLELLDAFADGLHSTP